MSKVKIHYYSDLLCVWAYLGHIRIKELIAKHGDKIDLDYHFTPTFASVETKVHKGWKEKGGIDAYMKHVKGLEKDFPHIQISEDCWQKANPASSANIHLFIKAIQLVEDVEQTQLEDFMWSARVDFFTKGIDITKKSYQVELAKKLSLPIEKIHNNIDTGKAQAFLQEDFDRITKEKIPGSPSLVFNHGRQVIYGNTGYKIIENSLLELLENKSYDQSWC